LINRQITSELDDPDLADEVACDRSEVLATPVWQVPDGLDLYVAAVAGAADVPTWLAASRAGSVDRHGNQ
jgi:hypothetical protein